MDGYQCPTSVCAGRLVYFCVHHGGGLDECSGPIRLDQGIMNKAPNANESKLKRGS
jgi:hypothetical protein